MDSTKTGGPAFPEHNFEWDQGRETFKEVSYRGMKMLDWFAGLAMPHTMVKATGPHQYAYHAKEAYEWAAAMIAERERLSAQ